MNTDKKIPNKSTKVKDAQIPYDQPPTGCKDPPFTHVWKSDEGASSGSRRRCGCIIVGSIACLLILIICIVVVVLVISTSTVSTGSPNTSEPSAGSPSVPLFEKCQDSTVLQGIPVTKTFSASYDSPNIQADGCYFSEFDGEGIWFHYHHQGAQNLSVQALATHVSSPTGYTVETSVSVYEGSCKALTCLDSRLNEGISWVAQPGVDYYVALHSNGRGTFTFAFDEVMETCETSSELLLELTNSTNGQGEILAMVSDFQIKNRPVYAASSLGIPEACGMSTTAPSRWFRVQGTGQPLRVSTCDPRTDFEASIAIYNLANGCLGLMCEAAATASVATAQDEVINSTVRSGLVCHFSGSIVVWDTRIDGDYLIQVGTAKGRPKQYGDFVLNVEEYGNQ